MAQFWGYHFLLNAGGCPKELITDKQRVIDFTYELIKEIDMEIHGEPWVEHFATHDPTKGGFTMLAMISTSNLAAHFVDETGEVYLDVHSCKTFSEETVNRVFAKYFSPKAVSSSMIYRKAPPV